MRRAVDGYALDLPCCHAAAATHAGSCKCGFFVPNGGGIDLAVAPEEPNGWGAEKWEVLEGDDGFWAEEYVRAFFEGV